MHAFSEVAVDSDISAPAALEEIVKAPGIRPNPDMNVTDVTDATDVTDVY